MAASILGLQLPSIPGLTATFGEFLSKNAAPHRQTLSTTKNQAYLVDTVTTEKLEIMFFPEQITQDHVSNFGKANVVGMSHPTYQWTNGEHSVELPLGFQAEKQDYSDILKKIEWLESLTYPEYSGDELIGDPHEVVITFGEMFRRRKFKVTNVRVEWGNVYHPQTMIPMLCVVNLTLKETVDRAVDFKVIRGS